MKIIRAYPPNIDKIHAAFGVKGKPVIFCYGGVIYAPNSEVAPYLVHHEAVHAVQQEEMGGPEPWWERYIEDREFRLAQEIPAHVAEIRYRLCHGSANRNHRRQVMADTASRLASPVYKFGIGKERARTMLVAAVETSVAAMAPEAM